jgi:hypothetical protein
MNEEEYRQECIDGILSDMKKKMLELNEAHKAGEITTADWYDQVQGEQAKAILALPLPKPVGPL